MGQVHTLDRDLFGCNPWGIAAYLEPSGWSRINEMRSPRAKSYANHTPATVVLSEKLHGRVTETRRWGHQLASGGWTTYTEDEPKGRFYVKSRSTPALPYFVEPLAKALAERDVLKHLLGRTCSVGCTDVPIDSGEPYCVDQPPNLVSSIRIDVDQDDSWLYERGDEVLAELRDQRKIVEAAGLSYTVFKTGGRGVQIVVPLPCPLEPTAASFLSRGLRLALRGRRNLSGLHVDRDAFDGLLRLPGGVHARGNTSLFIDVDHGTLFPLETQVEMIAGCLERSDARRDKLSIQLLEAQEQLRQELPFFVCNEDEVLPVVQQFPANPICAMLVRAFAAAELDLANPVRHVNSKRRPLDNHLSIFHCDRVWAKEIWDIDLQPGTWWEWIHMGGDRGMLAAVILFGSERSEARLLEKASSYPAASRTDRHERENTTRGLWKTFGLKEFKGRGGSVFSIPEISKPSTDIGELSTMLVHTAKASASHSARWSPDRVVAVLSIVLQVIAESEAGEARLTLRDIAQLLETHVPEQSMSFTAVANCLKIVCRMESGVDWSTVLDVRPSLVDPVPPAVEGLVRFACMSQTAEKALFLPGSAAAEFLIARGLLKFAA